MAHYALLDENNIVTQVITGRDEDEVVDGISDWEAYYGAFHNQKCLRTSYNTYANEHRLGGTPFRGNFAGVGYKYLEDADIFISPECFYPSWTLDLATASYQAPVPYPEDDNYYYWDEDALHWVQIEVSES